MNPRPDIPGSPSPDQTAASAGPQPGRHLNRAVPILAALLAGLILAALTFDLWLNRKHILYEGGQTAHDLAHVLEEHTARTLQAVDLTLTGITDSLSFYPGQPPRAEMEGMLRDKLRGLPYLLAIFITDRHGRVLYDTERDQTLVTVEDRPYFIAHRDDPGLGLRIGAPLVSRTTGQWFISLTRRIDDAQGNFAGVAVAEMEPDYFAQFSRAIDVGRHGAVGLFLNDGTVLARHPYNAGVVGRSFAGESLFRNYMIHGPQGIFRAVSPVDGVERIYSYRDLRGAPLRVLVGLGIEEQLGSWRSNVKLVAAAAVAFVLLVAGLTWLLARQLRHRDRLIGALARSEERFRDFAEAASDWLWETDTEHNLVYFSHRFSELTGLSAEWMKHRPRWLAASPDFKVDWDAHRADLDAHRPFRDFIYTIRRKDGQIVYVKISGRPIFDAEGRFLGYRGAGTDISEEVAAAEEATRFFEVTLNLLAVTGYDGYFKRLNPAWEKVLGYSRQELFSRPFVELIHPDDRAATLAAVDTLQKTGTTIMGFENRYRCKDGSYRWMSWTGIAQPERKVLYCAAHDITELKQTERMLRQAKEQAEEASMAKSRFLASASHDLRQPLNAISLLLGLLDEQTADPAAKTIIGRIGTSLDAMIDLFNSLLNLSKLDSGTAPITVGPVKADVLLQRLAADFSDVAHAKGLELRIVSSKEIFHSDGHHLERILRNLVSNAIRHTTHGKVLIGIRREGRMRRIEVWDTGPGIPSEQQTFIFEEFYQLNNPSRASGEGHGLGLAIVRRTAELLGHQLILRSTPGKGSCFGVIVPAADRGALAAAGAPCAPARPSLDGCPVMVVEDDPFVSLAMRAALEAMGCTVTTAENGTAALAALDGGAPPRLILADFRLPGGRNGLEVIADLRARLTGPIPAWVITGDLTTEIEAQAKRLNTGYMRKPIKPDDLRALVQHACG